MSNEMFAEILEQGQEWAKIYNTLAPALPMFCEGLDRVMIETQQARKAVTDILKGLNETSEHVSASGVVSFYKTLKDAGLDDEFAMVLTVERVKASSAASAAVGNAVKNASSQ